MKTHIPLPALTASQAMLVYFTVRYRMFRSKNASKKLGNQSEQAIEKMAKRLKKSGWFYQIQLPDRSPAYTLSRHAVRTLGLSKKALKAMGRAAVVTNIAMLCYCEQKIVERLTPDEVRNAYAELHRPGIQLGNYFIDASVDPPRLTWMLVDNANPAAVLVRKAEGIIRKAYRFLALRELMQARQYAIVILVPNERKKWLVDRVLAKKYFPNVTISAEVVSELEPLLLS